MVYTDTDKLLEYINDDNIESVKILLQKKININKPNDRGLFPFSTTIYNNNIKMVKLLIEYANQNNIILNLNAKDKDDDYPLLLAVNNKNIEIINELIDYANKSNIILKMNEKTKDGSFPLLVAIIENNIEIVKLLIEYANSHDMVLMINSNDIKDSSKVDVEILRLLNDYSTKHSLNLKIEDPRLDDEKEKLLMENALLKLELKELENSIKNLTTSSEQKNEENYKKELKKMLENNSYNILKEERYIWKIENWDQLEDENFSPEFDAVDHKWKISLYPNEMDGEDNEEFIQIGLENLDINEVNDSENIHIAMNFITAIRNNNYSCFFADYYNKYIAGEHPVHFSFNKLSRGFSYFISKKELFCKNKSNNSIIENNIVFIDIYIYIYEYNKERYIEELKSLTVDDGEEIEDRDENENRYKKRDEEEEKYIEWELINISSKSKFQKEFNFNKYYWKISLYPSEKNEQYISLKIENLTIENNKDLDFSNPLYLGCAISVRNVNNYYCFWAKGTSIISFSEETEEYKIEEFIKRDNFYGRNKINNINNLVDDDRLILGIYLILK